VGEQALEHLGREVGQLVGRRHRARVLPGRLPVPIHCVAGVDAGAALDLNEIERIGAEDERVDFVEATCRWVNQFNQLPHEQAIALRERSANEFERFLLVGVIRTPLHHDAARVEHQLAPTMLFAAARSSGEASGDSSRRAGLPLRCVRARSRSAASELNRRVALVEPKIAPAATAIWRAAGPVAMTVTCSAQSKSLLPTNA